MSFASTSTLSMIIDASIIEDSDSELVKIDYSLWDTLGLGEEPSAVALSQPRDSTQQSLISWAIRSSEVRSEAPFHERNILIRSRLLVQVSQSN